MNEHEFTALCARINSSIDIKEFVRVLDYYPEKAVRTGGLWRLFCPIHKDTLFRTLVLNPRQNTFQCEYSLCTAHDHGDLLDLLARVRGTTREYAVAELFERFGPKQLRLTASQEGALREHLGALPPRAPAE